ncbi:MAG: YtxH domain-containing protein [Candidatus Aminicenantes bacterium]|nr:MAG: YtxH domain-containing protein [Candidatus Aminicenantes bacterium]
MIGAFVGAIVGFLYYRFIGCKSGACIITRNPYISTIYWAVLGALIANILF